MSFSIGSEPCNEIEQKTRDANFVFAFIASFFVVYFYTFALIEAKYSIFLHLQPFRTGRILTIPETILFVLLFSLEILVLLWGVSALIWRCYAKITTRRQQYAAWVIPISVGFIYFLLITIQFQVLRYFKDGVSMALIRKLGGGDIGSAFHYVVNEIAQLLPTLVAGVIIFGAALFFLPRLSSCVSQYFIAAKWTAPWFKLQRIILLNLSLLMMAFMVGFYLPVLDKNLGYSLAHHVYLAPWRYITDFDLDGYGLIPRPVDHAPFDSTKHPYALEILANGIDENGVGGDLKSNIWRQPQKNWVKEQLLQRNVLLIVLESARADLYQAKYQDQWVMPTLRSLPGEPLNMIAHTAFSAPAITSIFNGSYSFLESGPSLIDHFNNLGYRTGVFSAQNEGFGKQDMKTGMDRADDFFDARSVSSDKRMYVSSSAIALTVPDYEVLSPFKEWVQTEVSSPFFAYINLQELHFPYSYKNIPKTLIDKPIPRYSISEEESDWLHFSYYNAARVVDSALADVINFLKQENIFDNTVILVVGDHGEELFDAGSLGHGTNISYEQNSPIAKLINSPWQPEGDFPIGLAEVTKLIHNSLVKEEQNLFSLDRSAIAFLGVRKPQQIGIFTKDGLIKYDFKKDTWLQQEKYGAKEELSLPNMHLIHLWESYVLSIKNGHQ